MTPGLDKERVYTRVRLKSFFCSFINPLSPQLSRGDNFLSGNDQRGAIVKVFLPLEHSNGELVVRLFVIYDKACVMRWHVVSKTAHGFALESRIQQTTKMEMDGRPHSIVFVLIDGACGEMDLQSKRH
jgi:hypothetical protein